MKIFVLKIDNREYEIGDLNNTSDEILENALNLVAYVKNKRFLFNISKRLYTKDLDQRLEKLIKHGEKLELTEKVFIKRINCKQYNKGA